MTAELAAALVAFQAELPHVGKGQTAKVKTKTGSDYSYSFADLADITEVVVPLLSKHGLAWTAMPTMSEQRFVLLYTLLHTSGASLVGEYPLPDPASHSPQEIGSAITYARRYSLTAVTGIAPGGEDDDGQRASTARSAPAISEDPLVTLKRQVVLAGQSAGLLTVDDLGGRFAELNGGLALSDATEAELRAFHGVLEDERRKGAREHKQLVADVMQSTQAGKGRKDSTDAGRVERVEGVAADDEFYEPAP